MAWRRIVSLGIASGIAVPAMSASLSYYDQYRRASLPANLVQAQRDFFGGHTYQHNVPTVRELSTLSGMTVTRILAILLDAQLGKCKKISFLSLLVSGGF